MTLDHDAVVELLGAYALDAVDGDEAEAVAAHLEDCERCTAELADFREAAGLIANSGGDAPEHLWQSIAAEIGAPEGEKPAPITQILEATGSRGSVAVPAPARRKWNSRPWMVVAVAAGVLVIAALGVQVARLGNRVNQMQTPTATQSISQAATSALGDPGAQHVELTAARSSVHSVAAASVAEIAVLPSGSAFLVNRSLPDLVANQTYQLWGQVGHRLISLGVLGNAPHTVAFHVDPGAAIAFYAVTAERAGGVIQSTHAPVAVSSMAV
jgi:anti-sigma factor RsiW